MLKSRGCLIMLSLFSLLWGCGGGGLNLPNVVNPPNPQPPSPTISVRVTLNMNQVYEGEEVTCTAEVSPSVQQVINWKQEPSSPSGTFSPMSGSVVRWRSPMVERATSFSLIAYIVVQGKTYEGEASIVVLDKSEPPVTPPSISLNYPSSEIIVGSGTLLTIIGSISQGSNALSRLQVIDSNGDLLQEWPAQPGAFRVDLERFGSPGRKVLKVRVVDSAGLFAEASIPVLNDDAQLDSAARELIRRYNVINGGTTRIGNTQNGPPNRPIKVYINSTLRWRDLIQASCDFWTRYTQVKFEVTTFVNEAESPCIVVADYTDKNASVAADTYYTYPTGDSHERDATIRLFKGWLSYDEEMKLAILEHEFGHALITLQHIDEDGPLGVLSSSPTGNKIISPRMQRAVELIYQSPPAWQP